MNWLIFQLILLAIYVLVCIWLVKYSQKNLKSGLNSITNVTTTALDSSKKLVDECVGACLKLISPYHDDGLVDTDACKITIGLISGYNYNNDEKVFELVEKLQNFPTVLNRVAEEVEKETGLYISFNIRTVTTVYKQEWGCPEGGETCYEISAIRNPMFVGADKSTDWTKSCILIADKLKTEYSQSSVTGEVYRTNMIYLKNQENTGKTEMLTTIDDKPSTKTVKDVIKKSLNK